VAGVAVGAVVGVTGGYLGKSAVTSTQTSTQTNTSTETQTSTQVSTETQTQTVNPLIPSSWDYEADVVVMGAGTTGLSAAIEAIAGGAKVIVLEKEPSSLLADSGHCAGTLAAAGSTYQTAAGITDSPDIFYAELTGPGTDPRINPGLARLIADNGAANITWLTEQGITWQTYCPLLDGQSTAPRLMAAVPNSSAYPTTLNASATAKGATILYNTPVTGLIRDPTNGVIGVTAKTASAVINVKASRGVVLAAGDPSANIKFLEMFGTSPSYYGTLPSAACPGDTGDAIMAAMAVGGAPICLDNAPAPQLKWDVVNTHINPDTSYGYAAGSTNVNAALSAYKYQPAIMSYAIWVNNAGSRFTNEIGSTTAADTLAQPNSTAYMVFDSVPAKANVVMHISAGHTYFNEWMAQGVLAQADTLADLATTLGISSSGLSATVTKWNGYCTASPPKDPDFGRTILGPGISVGPFYGMKSSMYSTQQTNGTLNLSFPDLHVVDEAGNPIPRLYAGGDSGKAGTMAAGHGTHMMWTFTSGRIAGGNAAQETPWS
jgi:fumarate reductase flavoprotein subunit